MMHSVCPQLASDAVCFLAAQKHLIPVSVVRIPHLLGHSIRRNLYNKNDRNALSADVMMSHL
jgi:hypothetical protein